MLQNYISMPEEKERKKKKTAAFADLDKKQRKKLFLSYNGKTYLANKKIIYPFLRKLFGFDVFEKSYHYFNTVYIVGL